MGSVGFRFVWDSSGLFCGVFSVPNDVLLITECPIFRALFFGGVHEFWSWFLVRFKELHELEFLVVCLV